MCIIYFQIKCVLYGMVFEVANQFSHPMSLSFDFHYLYSMKAWICHGTYVGTFLPLFMLFP